MTAPQQDDLRPLGAVLSPLLLAILRRIARNGTTAEARRLALAELSRRDIDAVAA